MVFVEVIASFKGFLQLRPVRLDDGFDQVNRYSVVAFCVLAGLILTFNQQLGNVIKCIGEGETNYPVAYIEEFCWTQGLYTIKEAYNLSWPDKVPYPGILPASGKTCFPFRQKDGSVIKCPKEKDLKPLQRVHHIWYQFVPFYFWACSVCFYIPYALFRKFCGIYELKAVFSNLNNQVSAPEDQQRAIDNVSRWLYIRLNAYMNNPHPYTQIIQKHSMFYTTIFIKVLYLTVSILCFLGTNQIFQIGSFATYGYDWLLSLPEGKDYIVMDTLFPKMVACELKSWGYTGIDTETQMCVLPQNVGIQYFFCIFWFILVSVNCTNFISLFNAAYRLTFIKQGYRRFLKASLLREEERYFMVWERVGTSGRSILEILINHCNAKQFEDIMEILCSLLISNYRKHQRRKSRIHNTLV